jgi:hypothetical protein
LGLGVYGLGFIVMGLGFGVSGSRFGVQGFSVSFVFRGVGSRVYGLRSSIHEFGFRVCSRFRV